MVAEILFSFIVGFGYVDEHTTDTTHHLIGKAGVEMNFYQDKDLSIQFRGEHRSGLFEIGDEGDNALFLEMKIGK